MRHRLNTNCATALLTGTVTMPNEPDERDEYDVYLNSWVPSPQLEHATLDTYVGDPLMQHRLLHNYDPNAVTRDAWFSGPKTMEVNEEATRRVEYFAEMQPKWSAHFRDLVLANGVPSDKFDLIEAAFREDWVDGFARRQNTHTMMGIKASIRDLDRHQYPSGAGKYVLKQIPDTVEALLAPEQTQALFDANSNLIQQRMADYLDLFGDPNSSGLNHQSVRRGVFMTLPADGLRRELHYLCSYSLALGPVEQFAQTWNSANRGSGVPIIFSARLPAVQTRTVAFAPFIKEMDLSQLELVVAPPVMAVQLTYSGEFGDIHEFEFE